MPEVNSNVRFTLHEPLASQTCLDLVCEGNIILEVEPATFLLRVDAACRRRHPCTAQLRRTERKKCLAPVTQRHKVSGVRLWLAPVHFCPNNSWAAALKWAQHAAAWLSGHETLWWLYSWGHKQMRCELHIWQDWRRRLAYYLVIIIYKTKWRFLMQEMWRRSVSVSLSPCSHG